MIFHTDMIGKESLTWFNALESVVISTLATTFLIGVSFIFDRGSINRRILLYIGFGYSLRLVGEIICAYNEMILGKELFPSIADIFYLLANIPILMGIVTIILCNSI